MDEVALNIFEDAARLSFTFKLYSRGHQMAATGHIRIML